MMVKTVVLVDKGHKAFGEVDAVPFTASPLHSTKLQPSTSPDIYTFILAKSFEIPAWTPTFPSPVRSLLSETEINKL